MSDMPRPRPPNLQRETTRHGKVVWYVRIDRGPRIRIKAVFGTPEFTAEYQAALSGAPRPATGKPASGTLSWLIERHRETAAWLAHKPATRRQRENIFRQVTATAGAEPFTSIKQKTIIDGRERRARTPAQARHFLDAMRGLFRWAKTAGHVKVDPTEGIDNPPQKRGPGFLAWTEDHVDAYWRKWPIGTRQRVWLDVLLYTGLRRGDAVKLGRQHIRSGVATLRTEKTDTEVNLPILPILSKTLAAGPCGDLTFIVGERGNPLTKEAFTNMFRIACRAARVPGSAHGVRKIAATTAAYNGATEAELDAIFGWTKHGMAAHYIKAANRKRLALQSASKLVNEERTSIPAPRGKVREREIKTK